MPEPTTLEPPTAPTPTPTPSPTMDAFDQTFADLDTPSAPTPPPTPEPEPAPTPTPDRPKDPATGKFIPKTEKPVEQKPEPKAPEKPVEPPKPAAGSDFEPPQVAKPSELRNWAKRMGTRAEQAEQNISKLNAKIRELESRQAPQVDTRALTDELVATKKRLQEYEGELKVTRYERSGEYKEKYEKPYQDAVRNAYADITELLVSVPDPNDPENTKERQATPQDFDEVYSLPLGPATKLAKQKFGDAYTEVLKHRSAIKSAAKAAMDAVAEHKGKAAEFEQQQTAQQKLEQEGRSQMFSQAVQAIAEKYPNLFGEREGDTTWNENLHKGRHMADLAFGDRQGLTPQQSAILDAQVHARVSAFPGLRAENDSLRQQLEAKDKEIAELRGSSPGKPGAAPVDTKGDDSHMTLDQAFDKAIPA